MADQHIRKQFQELWNKLCLVSYLSAVLNLYLNDLIQI